MGGGISRGWIEDVVPGEGVGRALKKGKGRWGGGGEIKGVG